MTDSPRPPDEVEALSGEELAAAGIHPGETPRQFFLGLGIGTAGCVVVSGILLLALLGLVVLIGQVFFGGLELFIDEVWGH
ncbi:MAG: hypothetical protein P1V51_00820 [Deltaproteobacteria bacterium]|nr:hypothetical protein [Deltaproteobacteria bacterium]